MNIPKPQLEWLTERLSNIGISFKRDFTPSYESLPPQLAAQLPALTAARITLKQQAPSRIKVKNRITVKSAAPVSMEQPSDSSESEEFIRDIVTIQSNEIAKNLFITMLRNWCGGSYVDASGNPSKNYFDIGTLMQVADHFNLPFVAIEKASHWYLMLKPPTTLIGKGFGALVYDPIQNGEVFLDLSQWTAEAKQKDGWKNFLGTSIACSAAARELISHNEYDLSLKGEPSELMTTKLALKQVLEIDSWNCGPICIFQAVLLAAIVDNDELEFYNFREQGLDTFENTFGIDVLTREQLLRPAA